MAENGADNASGADERVIVAGISTTNPNDFGTVRIDGTGEAIRNKRGPKPKPRDENGQIIRDGSEGTRGSSGTGTGKAQKNTSEVLTATSIQPIIMMVHMMLGARIPEFMITEVEAKQLAEALANYARHTKLKASDKTRDFISLVFVLCMVEGTRLLAVLEGVKQRRRQEASMQAPASSGSMPRVVPMTAPLPGM